MKRKIMTLLKFLPGYFVVILLIAFSFCGYFFQQHFQSKADAAFLSQVEEQKPQSFEEKYVFGKPVLLIIPRLDIIVELEDGNYSSTTNSWNVSSSKAHFATISQQPNNKSGNTVIYGHNTRNIFGKTKDLKVGDKLYLKTDNDLYFEYTFVSAEEVTPKDTNIFSNEGKPRLTLITCSGILDEKRRLMNFDLI